MTRMKSMLGILVVVVVFLSWKFVFSPEKLEFTDRAKVLQGLLLAADYKQAVKEYWQREGKFPQQGNRVADSVSVDTGDSIVGAIRVGEHGPGVISVHYVYKPEHDTPEGVAGARIMLVPEAFGDKLHWQCRGTVPEKYLPRTCQGLKPEAKSDDI